VPLEAIKKLWIALCHDKRRDMYKQTNREHPKRMKPYPESRRYRSIEQSYGSRHSSHEYLFCQCPVYGYLVTFHNHPSKPAAAAKAEKAKAKSACGKRN
jgi:hypothetical protein